MRIFKNILPLLLIVIALVFLFRSIDQIMLSYIIILAFVTFLSYKFIINQFNRNYKATKASIIKSTKNKLT